MSDDNTSAAPLPEIAAPESGPEAVTVPEIKDNTGANGNDVVASAPEPEKEVATEMSAPVEAPAPDTNGEQTSDKVIDPTTSQDIEMNDAVQDGEASSAPAQAASESAEVTADTPASSSKAKTPRRKSGVPEHKGKKLNRKASKAKITNTDAKPGDYFYVRLKGHPLWPSIVADETMLPDPILKSRPVTAAREDGTYREDYADGGSKMALRTFPVMFLQTNEFSWIPNYDLLELNPDEIGNNAPKTPKALVAAYVLAAEQHDLDYFKDILRNFVEQKAEAAAAEAAELAAKEAKKLEQAAKKKSTPKKPKPVADADGDGDVDMADVTGEPDDEGLDVPKKSAKKASAKRKPEDDAETPQRADSVKKIKTTIKLNTPKPNGTATPNSVKDSAKSAKPKKKPTPKVAASPEVAPLKEPELTAEEKRVKKEKEILFLRHKLQKGLLTKDQDPKEEEMKQMSEFVTKLEGYADLEVSIIRGTKINKVLKAILKLPTIPKEDEFQFKSRSTALLEKWNKLLASEQGTPVATTATNGVKSEAKAGAEESKASPTEPEPANGVKAAIEEPKVEEKAEVKVDEEPAVAEAPPSEVKEESKVVGAVAPSVDDPVMENIPEQAKVETTA